MTDTIQLPNQNFPATTGEVNLTEVPTEWLIVYFYPKDSTPGCTVQACGLRDSEAQLAAQGVVVLGLSPDKPAALARFVAKENLNFRLLADSDHAVAEQWGVWGPKKFMGKDVVGIHRTSFLVGLDGVIENVFDSFKTTNHHELVLAYLNGQR